MHDIARPQGRLLIKGAVYGLQGPAFLLSLECHARLAPLAGPVMG